MTRKNRIGSCQCGHVRYRLAGTATKLAVCHCTECQKQSASAFGMSLGIRPEDFELTSGELMSFDVTCDSGRTKTCAFCPKCGSRIYHQVGNGMSIKAGTLKDTSDLMPDAHYWTRSKQPWVNIPPDAVQFEDDG
ncbi:GFA family protein [Pyruvatibacter sp.]|uniref:GFA family protein n=1 Tax=Pyruvatibacter sp. TaxID=1981328 RepID=UPI00326414EF